MYRVSQKIFIACLIFVCYANACAPTPILPIPEETDDGWRTTSLERVGIRAGDIREAISRVEDGTYQNIHSIVIVKDDRLVFEEYFQGYTWRYGADQYKGDLTDYDRDTIHNLASVTKSFTSALVGIAIDQGFIHGVEDALFDYFPEYEELLDDEKDAITLEHLLTMTSGFEWNGERIISEEWVRESTLERESLSTTVGYGYQWWLSTYRVGSKTLEAFHASGWGGQEIVVFPSLEMVVVFTGGNYVGAEPSGEILTQHILTAVE